MSLAILIALRAISTDPSSGCEGFVKSPADLATPCPVKPSAFTAMSVIGFTTASLSQSASSSSGFCSRSGGALPPSTIDIITEISAMPSAMQWWMRTMIALPPS